MDGMSGAPLGMMDGPPDPVAMKAGMEQAAKTMIQGNIGLWLGPLLLGLIFDMFLLGIAIHQFSLWIGFHENERTFNKVIVWWCMVISVGTSCFTVAYMMHLFVYSFGSYGQFIDVNWFSIYSILDVAIVTVVQLYYVERAYRVSKNAIWVPIIVTPLMMGSLVGAIGPKVVAARVASFLAAKKVQAWLYTWFACTLATDLFLFTVITYFLWRSRTGWTETDFLISRLVMFSVETQFPATLLALVMMIQFTISPPSFVGIFFQCFHSKAYLVMLLAAVNFRFDIRRDMSTVHHSSGHKSRSNQETYGSGGTRRGFGSIKVDTDVQVESHALSPLRTGLNRQGLGESSPTSPWPLLGGQATPAAPPEYGSQLALNRAEGN